MRKSKTLKRIDNACQKAGKPWGCPTPTTEMLASGYQQGARFLVVSPESGGWRYELERGMSTYTLTCEEGS